MALMVLILDLAELFASYDMTKLSGYTLPDATNNLGPAYLGIIIFTSNFSNFNLI